MEAATEFKEIPLFCMLYTVQEFREKVIRGQLIEKGTGYFCSPLSMSNCEFDYNLPDTRPMWATHVAWVKTI